MKERLITAGVVFGGIVALGVAVKLGVHSDLLAAGASVVILLAGSLRSMLSAPAEKKDTQ